MNIHVKQSHERSKDFHKWIAARHAYNAMKGINPEPYWPGMWMGDLIWPSDRAAAPKFHHVSFERILSLVCETYDVHPAEVLSPMRTANIVHARHIVYYLARERTKYNSFDGIAQKINRDHTSVIHGYRKIKWLMTQDAKLAAEIERLIEALA